MDNGLILNNLCIAQGDTRLFENFNARIAPQSVLTLMGPSGSGKSTLLAAITGSLAPEFSLSGEIWLNGRALMGLPPEQRRTGILFQDHLLFPHLSVADNLAFGLARGVPDRRARVEAALAEIDLVGFGPRDPATLSGGQRARVALMRTLLSEPEVLLLDEPFSRLDTDLRARMRDMVFSRAHAAGLPVLLVTHDAADAVGEVVRL
ncbi:MAG: ABC transporter ATP-binding protein [Rhodobacterales bacterium]|nr:MAG: ABC transporter ATP-binding protein [Rhodobacterales bacterium]